MAYSGCAFGIVGVLRQRFVSTFFSVILWYNVKFMNLYHVIAAAQPHQFLTQ